MYAKDRFIESFMEKAGWIGIFGIAGFLLIAVIAGVIVGAGLKSAFRRRTPPSGDGSARE
ncbi:hypothetical protein [Paenibacillus flagellatus]|uniref:Uncharacterized protein n=1 Tax=Paenibacillus flagellatus TaxID=2211139 RepID=A0A2V5KTM1_9BACL|nr:hypothetical protein [Paenibacillus flagellatus]PYI55117.1 hypothetical protein DLM86_11350 [Paenibacillus flagellatus]